MLKYHSALKIYLRPCLGTIKLEKIGTPQWQRIIDLGKSRKIGAASMNRMLDYLRPMLNDAVKLNYLARNPLVGLERLKVPKRNLSYWLPEQVRQFLECNQDDPYYPLYAFVLNTGLRKGELLGLCWDKVDRERKMVEIARTWVRSEPKETTKTGVTRHVPLNNSALEILEDLAQKKKHSRFVFAVKDGALPYHSSLSSRFFKRAIARAGVPEIRFHDLRTTYASNFVMAGGDIFALSKILGHTSVEMIAKKYADLHPRYMVNVASTVEFRVIPGGNGPDLAQIGDLRA